VDRIQFKARLFEKMEGLTDPLSQPQPLEEMEPFLASFSSPEEEIPYQIQQLAEKTVTNSSEYQILQKEFDQLFELKTQLENQMDHLHLKMRQLKEEKVKEVTEKLLKVISFY